MATGATKEKLDRPVLYFSDNVTIEDMKLAKEVREGLVKQGLAEDQILLVHRDWAYNKQMTGPWISVADKDKPLFRFKTTAGNTGRHLGLATTARRIGAGEQVVVKVK